MAEDNKDKYPWNRSADADPAEGACAGTEYSADGETQERVIEGPEFFRYPQAPVYAGPDFFNNAQVAVPVNNVMVTYAGPQMFIGMGMMASMIQQDKSENARTCPVCGAKAGEEHYFCRECGARLAE